jgi:hypothetical protein
LATEGLSMSTTIDEDVQDWGDFSPQPSHGDLKTLHDLIQRAGEVQAGITKLETRTDAGKKLLKNILETEIPELMAKSGFKPGDQLTYGGITVKLEKSVYANVPAKSSIEKERDDEQRAELIARRNKAFEILEEKAPSLIKRKYEISFERDAEAEAKEFEAKLKTMENAPDFSTELSVHPQTLAKWLKEYTSDGTALTEEQAWAFGKHTREVAKISK